MHDEELHKNREQAREFLLENEQKLGILKKELRSQLIVISSAILPLFLIFNNGETISTSLKYSVIALGLSVIFGMFSVLSDYFAADVYYYVSHNLLSFNKDLFDIATKKSTLNENELLNLENNAKGIEKITNKSLTLRYWFSKKSLQFLMIQMLLFLVSFIGMLWSFYVLT